MNFIPLSAHEMTRSFFSGVYFAVWNTYEDRNHFHFLDYDGTWYITKYSKKLEELFPVIKNLKWSKRGWEDWTWYYMGMGGGAVFVHKFILDKYKEYAGIDDKYIEHGPNYNAALKALEDLKNRRADRFTCHPGDFIVCESEVKFMNEKKSTDYKKLVEDMQKKYPVYHNDIKPTDTDKQRAQNFAEKFATPKKFLDSLAYRCAGWEKSLNETINKERALKSLAISIANGYDLKVPVALFSPVVNGTTYCNEINLYTYWQGFGYAEKTPKIKYLLVAQDWGNLFRRDPKDNQCFVKMNETGKYIAYNGIPTGNNTDANLFRLFNILGYDLSKRNEDLFFTNFCLGYRIGNEQGGMNKKLMMNDSEEFKRLCEILEPENILCLGQITSECAYKALNGARSWKKIYGGFKNYNDFIENHDALIVKCGDTTARFYPLSHCGGMGTANRNRNLPKQSDSLYYQKQDWQKILRGE